MGEVGCGGEGGFDVEEPAVEAEGAGYGCELFRYGVLAVFLGEHSLDGYRVGFDDEGAEGFYAVTVKKVCPCGRGDADEFVGEVDEGFDVLQIIAAVHLLV